MTDIQPAVCRTCCGTADDGVLVSTWGGAYQHSSMQDCLLSLKRQRNELRNLLAIAVDEYEKRGVLTAVWYRQSKKAVKT